jgi:hypothetical protein
MEFVDGFFRITSHLHDAFCAFMGFHKAKNLIQAGFKLRASLIGPFWLWRKF